MVMSSVVLLGKAKHSVASNSFCKRSCIAACAVMRRTLPSSTGGFWMMHPRHGILAQVVVGMRAAIYVAQQLCNTAV